MGHWPEFGNVCYVKVICYLAPIDILLLLFDNNKLLTKLVNLASLFGESQYL